VTAAGRALREALRSTLARLDEHAKRHPGEVDAIVATLVAHLRGWRPESVSPLGTLPPPTERICDPRGDR